MPRSITARRRPVRPPRPASWLLCVLSMLPAALHAISVPDCAKEMAAFLDRRYQHWLQSDVRKELVAVSDSITISIDSDARIDFFDGRAYGERLRTCVRERGAAAANSCLAPARTAFLVSPPRQQVEAAVRLREHNAKGVASPEEAARVLRACPDGIWVSVPYNLGALVTMKMSDEPDSRAAICFRGAVHLSKWLNRSRDGGRSWSLEPSFGWCQMPEDGGPGPPSSLQHAPPQRTR